MQNSHVFNRISRKKKLLHCITILHNLENRSIVRERIALKQSFCYPKTVERKYSGKLTMFLPFTISEPRFKIRKEKKGNEDGKREIRKLQEGIEAIGAEINSRTEKYLRPHGFKFLLAFGNLMKYLHSFLK